MNQFNLPLCMRVQSNASDNIFQIISQAYPGASDRKFMLITDSTISEMYSGKIKRILSQFTNAEMHIISSSSFDEAMVLAKEICVKDISITVGFGGGRVLDMAKFASFVAKAKYFGIPTALSNDGVASPVAVLNSERDVRKTFSCKIPDGIIVDTEIVKNAPLSMLKAGVGDTISNYTALYDWKLDLAAKNKKLNDFAYLLSDVAFSSLFYTEIKSLHSNEFITLLTQSLVLSGLAMEIAGSSRPCSGSEHLFCHALEEKYTKINIPHGMAVAIGTMGASYMQGRDYKQLLEYLYDFGVSIDPMQWGITEEIYLDAWRNAASTRKDRHTILNEVPLPEGKLLEIYKEIRENDL